MHFTHKADWRRTRSRLISGTSLRAGNSSPVASRPAPIQTIPCAAGGRYRIAEGLLLFDFSACAGVFSRSKGPDRVLLFDRLVSRAAMVSGAGDGSLCLVSSPSWVLYWSVERALYA